MVRIEETASSETFYDEHRDVIVIDTKLREYPKALKMSVLHELKHAYIEDKYDSPTKKLIQHAKHELATDIEFAFSNAERHRQIREYVRKELGGDGVSMILSYIRSIWTMPLYAYMSHKTDRELS